MSICLICLEILQAVISKSEFPLISNSWLWINSGVRQRSGHGVATGALFGVPSDILIWPHFHSQAAVPFVLAGVCWGFVNLLTPVRNQAGEKLR